MPTLWSHTLIPTLRQVPAEAEVPSHQMMLRAGFIRKLSAGVYDYLPLGWRSLQKAMSIVREEMNAAGAVEVFLPSLAPIELFQQTGRDVAYGDNLFKLTDRHQRQHALGPTHEEVITEMVGGSIESYRQLPLTLYQIQTKFRDEFRPRFGVLRSREFQMKDAYSFHVSIDGPGGLDETYQRLYDAYCRIFARCGLPYVTVEAESGPIGGSASHEFMVLTPTGEDSILESDTPGSPGSSGSPGSHYAANMEKCAIGTRKVSASFAGCALSSAVADVPAQPPKGELTKIHTPGCPGIADVVEFFKKNLGSKLAPKNMLKTLVMRWAIKTGHPAPPAGQLSLKDLDLNLRLQKAEIVIAVVRGDHEVNEAKLDALLRTGEYSATGAVDAGLAAQLGFLVGFVGPDAIFSRRWTRLIIDPDAAIDQFWVTGANEIDHHVKSFHWQRELLDPLAQSGTADAMSRVLIADLRNAADGDPSPKNDGGVLKLKKGIEIGHVFKLGDKYSKAMNMTVLGPDNQRMHPIMGCYGIGVNRILAAAIERRSAGDPQAPSSQNASGSGSDENGIIWPSSISPYQVLITPIKYDGRAKEVADALAKQLEQMQSPTAPKAFFHPDVLIDDRDERPGVKFKDADLIGVPVRITLGDKALAENKVEIKIRDGSLGQKGELVDIAAAPARVLELLAKL